MSPLPSQSREHAFLPTLSLPTPPPARLLPACRLPYRVAHLPGEIGKVFLCI
jgi:hypothetical protein